jgi:hypothetical protein
VAFIVILIAALAFSLPRADATSEPEAAPTRVPRVCFSEKLWSADDARRPCVRVARVEEDGSFRATVSDADGRVRYRFGVGSRD